MITGLDIHSGIIWLLGEFPDLLPFTVILFQAQAPVPERSSSLVSDGFSFYSESRGVPPSLQSCNLLADHTGSLVSI